MRTRTFKAPMCTTKRSRQKKLVAREKIPLTYKPILLRLPISSSLATPQLVAHLSPQRASVIHPSCLIPETRCLNSPESIMHVSFSIRRTMLTSQTDDYRSNVGSLLSVTELAYLVSSVYENERHYLSASEIRSKRRLVFRLLKRVDSQNSPPSLLHHGRCDPQRRD